MSSACGGARWFAWTAAAAASGLLSYGATAFAATQSDVPAVSGQAARGTILVAQAAPAAAPPAQAQPAMPQPQPQPMAAQAAQVPSAPPPGGKLFPLTFPSLKVVSRSVVTYRCDDGRELGVAYMNTDNQQSFAVIRLDGRHLVFVNVLAGSGARYTADKYVWWSKGPEGNLYDLTKGENAAPIAKGCKALTQ